MTQVIDASVAVKWLIEELRSDKARALLQAIETDGNLVLEPLLAPSLLLIECHYAISKRHLRGEATREQLTATIPALSAAFGTFVPLDERLAESAALMSVSGPASGRGTKAQPFGIYDCVYIALAYREGATLVTADTRQAEYSRALNVPVLMI